MIRCGVALVLLVARCMSASMECAECHREIYERQAASRHAKALRPFAGSPVSIALERFPVADGGYRYEYSGAVVHIVSASGGTMDAPLEWAFGSGSVGFTAVGRLNGRFFEHRVSWLTKTGHAVITPGQPERGVLGVTKTPTEAFACFNCHSTSLKRGADGGPDLQSMSPGIQCGRCHGQASKHIEAARSARAGGEIRAAIFDGGRLPAKAAVQVCGECHRTSGDLQNLATVRFQPVGLMASRCFNSSPGISCVTCHDPHGDAVRNNAGFYAARCVACHASGACFRENRADCISCHMRQTELAAGLKFTDHRIRIYP